MKNNFAARITGLGSYLPKRILSNNDLEKMVDTSDEWIVTRTGIKERRIALSDEYTSTMGTYAARKAIEQAGLNPTDIDAIICATMTPDYLCPSTAALIQSALGANRACAIDIQAACTGFLYALSIAKAWVESKAFTTVLVIASEKNSSFIDYTDRNMCVLFGDGAGACIVQNKGSGFEIKHVCLGADGNEAMLLSIPAGGSHCPATQETIDQKLHYMKMNGKEVFKHAVRRMESAAKECLEATHMQEADINWLIPHQANLRIMDAIAKRFNIPDENIVKTIDKYGNTSASTIPIALAELDDQGAIHENENILLIAFGGGLTWGACMLTKSHT